MFQPSPAQGQGRPTTFTLQGRLYQTAGMTSEQMLASFELTPVVDKALGKGYSRDLLGKILGKPGAQSSRNDLDEAKAEKFLHALRQAAAAGPGA